MTHIDHILSKVPDLSRRTILDVGAGRGAFLIDAAQRGFAAEGIEYNPDNVAEARRRAQEVGVSISIVQGSGESLPYPDASFSFVNVAEVLEHVGDHKKVLAEVARVLTDDGVAYVSIPNRFGFIDPHFHLRGVNWMPRSWAEWYIGMRGRYKEATGKSGFQRLSDMHYMTKGGFARLCREYELEYRDAREEKVQKLPCGRLLVFVYRAYAFLFIPTFHGFVVKQ